MNKSIVVAVFVIGGVGVVNRLLVQKPITTIVIGSYLLLLILALMDMFGGGMSKLASAFALLATTYVVLTELPWQQVINFLQGKKA